MNSPESNSPISRRDFVRTASLAAAAVTSGVGLAPAKAQAPAGSAAGGSGPLIGFQAEVPYLLTYGIGRFLDDIQARAGVNTLFLSGGLYDASANGDFAAGNPQFYKDVALSPRGLGTGDVDLPDAMLRIKAELKKRDMKLFAWMLEDNRPQLKVRGIDKLYEVDLHGRRTDGHPGGPCLNNPYYRNLIAGSVEDSIRSYDVDGLQRGSERQGSLSNALGAWHHGSMSDPGKTSCFCEYCTEKAAKKGIDVDRVKAGFLALEPYVRDGRAGKRPRDGYYVEFWRILLRHPELLTWQTFWSDSMREMQREFYAKAKSIKPDVQVGFHIWHNTSFNPIYRAEQDYRPYAAYADFLKPVLYDNPAAERMTSYVYSATQNIYGDLSRQQLLDFEYSVMNYKEQSYEQIIGGADAEYEAQLRRLGLNDTPNMKFGRFSGDYVLRETKRAVEAVADTKTVVWPGVGIDVVLKNSTPDSVRDAVHAVFEGGGRGLILCTSHAAMRPENLSAVGATLRELKLA